MTRPMLAERIAKALGGHPTDNGWLCHCPVPSHGQGLGDRNPSLWICDGDERLLAHCYAGCDTKDVLAMLLIGGLLNGRNHISRNTRASIRDLSGRRYARELQALEFWRDAGPVWSSVVVKSYLRSCGITVDIPPTIRAGIAFLPGIWGLWFRCPVMISAVQNLSNNNIVAVERTFFPENGACKASIKAPRQTTGSLALGAVRLAPATAVLGLAKGVETGLSAMELTGVPIWCALTSGQMDMVEVPDVREVHIFADDDDAGRAAAERTAERHSRTGRRVQIRFPPAGCKDWNDALRRSR